jgi:hypothetical protein
MERRRTVFRIAESRPERRAREGADKKLTHLYQQPSKKGLDVPVMTYNRRARKASWIVVAAIVAFLMIVLATVASSRNLQAVQTSENRLEVIRIISANNVELQAFIQDMSDD